MSDASLKQRILCEKGDFILIFGAFPVEKSHIIMIMIKNLYSAKTIEEYSKALYIELKLKFKIPKN